MKGKKNTQEEKTATVLGHMFPYWQGLSWTSNQRTIKPDLDRSSKIQSTKDKRKV